MKTFYTVPVSYLFKLCYRFIRNIRLSIFSLPFTKTGKSIFILFFALAAINAVTAQTCPSGSIVYVNASATGTTHDGTTWAKAYLTLQDALYIVKNCTAGKQIWVAKGTYYADEGSGQTNNSKQSTFQLKNNVAIYGGFAGTETSLTARNYATNVTTLSGDIDKNNVLDVNNSLHIVTGSLTNNTAVLDGFTITRGYYSGNTDGGGGLYSYQGSPTVVNCIFLNNRAYKGGAMYNGNSSNPRVTNCAFYGNYADYGGGAIENKVSSAAVFLNCSVSGNATGSSGNGGGIDDSTSNPVITNCVIWNNKDKSGVGTANSSLYNKQSTPNITYSLLQALKPSGTGNIDGTNASNNPLFTTAANPNTTPNTTGNLRLQCGSPVLDKGNNSDNTTTYDLDDKARKVNGVIDLGAYENVGGCCPPGNIVYVDSSKISTGAHTGFSWADAFISLQDALTLASKCSNVTQIWVAKGTYYPGTNSTSTFHLKNNLAIYGGFNDGTDTIFPYRDWKTNITILSGDNNKNLAGDAGDAYNVTTGSGTNNTALLDGFTITGGYSTSALGGGMNNNQGSPTINNCIFSGNTAYEGGGMQNDTYSNPVITNCIFAGNSGLTAGGGGMANFNYSNPVIINCVFSGNSTGSTQSPSAGGGGILNGRSNPIITNCTFSGNYSPVTAEGMQNTDSSKPIITNCIFWNNRTKNISTAVIYNDASSKPKITYSLVQGLTTADASGNLDGISNKSDTNYPLFKTPVDSASLPNNRGDLRLQCYSPAIDKGNNAANKSLTDLDYNQRIIDDIIDLGAYENQGQCCPKGNIVYVDSSNTSTTHDGTSWATAYVNLQDALYYTSNCTDSKQIWVAKGTYYPEKGINQVGYNPFATFQLKNNLAIYGGFAGTEISLAARNWKINTSILHGHSQWFNSIIKGYHIDSTAKMDGFTVTGNYNYNGGGGMINDSASPVISNCIFSYNTTKNDGGGMENINNSNPVIINCVFAGNSAFNGYGGGMKNESSNPVIINCIFSGDSASTAGAIGNIQSNATINNCTFTGNTDVAIFNGIYSTSSITNSIIWNNTYSFIVEPSSFKISYSLIQGVTSNDSNHNLDGTTNAADTNYPRFVIPVNPNTAPTAAGNLRLQKTSPAIDKGNNAADTVATDLDGNARIVNGIIDLGAYESNYCTPPTLTASSITANAASGSCSASVAFGTNVTVTGTPAPTLVYKIGNTTISSPYVFPVGKTTVSVTATNTCGSVSASFTVTVKDAQKPVVTCKPGATRTGTGITYTISGAEFNATATDNCKPPTLIYSLSGATTTAFNAANTSLAGVKLNVGTTTITWKATDSSNNNATCSTVVTVNSAALVAGNNNGNGNALKTTVEINKQLKVFASPNPSNSQFALKLRSGSNANCRMMVMDITGRKIEELPNVAANSTVQIGRSYYPGVYVAVVMQGDEKVSLKLVKEGK